MAAGLRALRARVAFDGVRFAPEGLTVLVEEGRIVGAEPFACDLPTDCSVDEFEGTLLPGLIDGHVHLVADGEVGSLENAGTMPEDELDAVIAGSLSQQAAAGVTTVRDLGDTRFRTLAVRDELRRGAPRIVASGPPLTVPGGHCHFLGGVVTDADAGRRLVADHHERGIDVVKPPRASTYRTTSWTRSPRATSWWTQRSASTGKSSPQCRLPRPGWPSPYAARVWTSRPPTRCGWR